MRRLALIALVSLALPVAPAEAADAGVSMVNVRFEPAEVQVTPGSTVTWTNDDGMPHEVTADDGSFDSSPACEPSTGTGCVESGESFAHTFTTAGRYPYHCPLHGSPGRGMTGIVVVG